MEALNAFLTIALRAFVNMTLLIKNETKNDFKEVCYTKN